MLIASSENLNSGRSSHTQRTYSYESETENETDNSPAQNYYHQLQPHIEASSHEISTSLKPRALTNQNVGRAPIQKVLIPTLIPKEIK